ncbi:MAG: DMT family transporter [Erysipelotrichaceae bacterium]|nr:DMT family transporter [Erysipelotrichaceae bacterium]
MKNKGNLYILFCAMLWSTSGIFLKSTVGSSVAINGARSIIALLVFMIYERKDFKFRINKVIFSAGCCLALTNILYFLSARLSTTANAIAIQYIAPVFVLIWTSLYHHRRPKPMHVISILLAIAGVVVFFSDGIETGYLLGNAIAALAGLCFSGVFFLNTLPESSSTDASKLGFLLSFIIAIPFLSTIDYGNTASNLSILGLGVFQVGLAYILYGKGIVLTDPVSASLISILEVVFVPIWSFIFYHDLITIKALFGAMMIIGGVILATIKND